MFWFSSYRCCFAADRKPDVTIVTMKKYEIVIDGKTYFNYNKMMEIENLRNGRHSIQVFEMNRGFSIFKRKQLVASRSFMLRNNDVKITIDRFGQLSITEDKFGRDDKYGNNQRDWEGHDDQKGHDDHHGRDNHDRKY